MFLYPRYSLRICFRETGSAVPSRVSLLILHTLAECGAYSRDSSRFPRRRPFIYLNRHRPSGQSRVYRITQLHTDGVRCRQSASTRPVVLKVVPLRGAASYHHGPINERLSFSTPTIVEQDNTDSKEGYGPTCFSLSRTTLHCFVYSTFR